MSVTQDLRHELEVRNRHWVTELSAKHPGWRIWLGSKGSPMATRRVLVCPPGGQLTLVCNDWDQLESELAAESRLDARQDGPTWDIFEVAS
jgi:predicted NAD/FAD-dependent oxidoreductase